MSLKAKLEAVIYAAEEPVTLAQLAALFAADALEWKAEQHAALAARISESSNPPREEIDRFQLNEEFNYLETDQPAADSIALELVEVENPIADNADGENAAANPEASSELAVGTGRTGEAAAEARARRLARLRDREVRVILRQLLDELIESYASDGRGVEIREIAGGYRMATKPECHDAVRAFVKSLKPPLKLSLPALETLAVIAYKQPVTAPEVNEIRGVDSSAVFGSLLARKLIATAGRKQVIGRPILYKTTREFLLRFGLKDVSELPSMEEFEKLAAAELDDTESQAGGESALAIREDLSLELGPAAEDDANTLEAASGAPPPTE